MRRRAAIQLKRADDLALSLQASSSPLSAQQQSVASASIAATLSTDGQPLDEATRAFMEPHFGYDFSQVRIFADDQAAETAAALHAQAYTVGNNIVFGDGQYTPGTPEGQRLIAHEVAHVIQQSQGPVAGRSFGDGLTISDPADAEEQAADQTANHIERSRSSQDTNPPLSSSLHAVNPPSDSETEQLPEENEHSGTDAVLEGAGRATPFIIQRKKIDAPPPNDDDLLSRRFQARQPNHDFTVLPVYAADIDSAIYRKSKANHRMARFQIMELHHIRMSCQSLLQLMT